MKATDIWSNLPQHTRSMLEANVFCRECGVVAIADYRVTRQELNIVLKGTCAKCGRTVARVVEVGVPAPMSFNIRVCTESDFDVLQGLCEDLAAEYGDTPEGVRGRISQYTLLAESEGRPVGFILAEEESIEFMKSEIGRSAFPDAKTYLEIQELYVVPEYRDSGVGTALVKRVLASAREAGLHHSMVYSANADYIRTARFYEKSGFKMWHIFMTQQMQ